MEKKYMSASELCLHTIKSTYDEFIKNHDSLPKVMDLQVGHEYSCRTVRACLKALELPYAHREASTSRKKVRKKDDDHSERDTKILNYIQKYIVSHPFGPSMREIAVGCGMTVSVTYSDMLYLAVTGQLEFYPSIGRSVRLADTRG